MKAVTKYFRNAIAVSSQSTIEYKNGEFGVIKIEELENEKIKRETIASLLDLDKIKENNNEKDEKMKSMIVALKTISTDYMDHQHTEDELEEMTSVLFMPIQVSLDGKLFIPLEGKMPWIPREYLAPLEDSQLSIGEIDKYDEFFEITTSQRNQITTFEDYLKYTYDLYEYVTNSKFTDNYILSGGRKLKTDNELYIFVDKTVYATFHILQLYNHLLKNDDHLLYNKITNGNLEKSKSLFKNTNILKMKSHVGQMSGEFPLSSSQREAINHFSEIEKGEILAIKGPPGTGKTTLLQSVVANMYVERALDKDKAPIIVAASTNNQAVTNIIDSFGKIKKISTSTLEERWITGVNSFATYFPSKGKTKEAKDNNYQFTDVNGSEFASLIEMEENRQQSNELFHTKYEDFFGDIELNLSNCLDKIHNELYSLNKRRVEFLEELDSFKLLLKDYNYIEYVDDLSKKIVGFEKVINNMENQDAEIRSNNDFLITRSKEWSRSYNDICWYIRLLKFIPYFHDKIVEWIYSFMENDETTFLKRNMNIKLIIKTYQNKILDNDVKLKKTRDELIKVKNDKKELENDLNYIKTSMDKLNKSLSSLLNYHNFFHDDIKIKNVLELFDICKINNLLDEVRYIEFWLSVHYYECRWLNEINPINEKQKGKTFMNVLDDLYHRIAMVSPCMVMTFFMLPKQFYAYDGNTKQGFYMYNYIDLLIVDEAGQISPEIASGSFSLAKKAVVVGDEQQIPPVWTTTRALDIAMAISKEVIKDKNYFSLLESNGLNCSQSNLMKIACRACAFDKYGKGLFLSEHRRCYNEIIQYCNDLVYGGNLEPLRGFSKTDKTNCLNGILPAMGYKNIISAHSEKCGCSRRNRKEAEKIVEWIGENYSILIQKYLAKGDKTKSDILGVITPFKSQSVLIKRILKKEFPDYYDTISIGTVHTFQGAERKVIIFSSVYGSEDDPYFINSNNSLMNVAVSRTKDSFLVFGDIGCLKGDPKSATMLLKNLVEEI